MTLDNIHLTNLTCQNLFEESLIGDVSFDDPTSSSTFSTPEYLGLNKKKILFLVNNPENKYLSTDEMEVLANLLTACRLSMDDVALVNYGHYQNISYEIFREQLQAEKCLIFGVSTAEIGLPFNVPDFQIQSFNEQLYLFSPPFHTIVNDVALKGKLWSCLKKLFLS